MIVGIELRQVLLEIQKEVKEEENIDISIEEIADILESQFHAVLVGINYDVGIRIPLIGKFYAKANKDSGRRSRALKAIREEIGEEEYKRRVEEQKVFNKEQTKKAAKKRQTNITLEELLKQNNRDVLMTRYNKVLQELKYEK